MHTRFIFNLIGLESKVPTLSDSSKVVLWASPAAHTSTQFPALN